MMQIRRSEERGHFNHGWLDTYHTFSFGDYYDPEQMNFRTLRVMNEDRVQAGQGFGMHGHRDMEILTYVLEGALAHRDSLGNESVLRAGELQRMSAGTGIQHSEYNSSRTAPVHLYQIWIIPERRGLTPGYEQRAFATTAESGHLRLVAAPRGHEQGVLTIHQDARVYLATLKDGQTLNQPLAPGRHAWLQVLRGEASVNGHSLATGDGAAISEEAALTIQAAPVAEVMLFDLA